MSSFGAVPPQLRVGLPIGAAVVLSLLIVAHTQKGISSEVDGDAPLGTLKPHTVLDDTFISAARSFYNARNWLLFFMHAVLSGIWPYVKLLSVIGLVALANLGKLPRDDCYHGLCLLEVLGKLSYSEVILLCFNVVIFDINTGGVYGLTYGSLELHIYTRIKFACVAMFLALAGSAFLTHLAADMLRPLPSSSQRGTKPMMDGMARQKPERSSWLGLMVALAAFLGIVLLVVGSCIPSIEVQRGGFLGKLMGSSSEQTLELSIVTVLPRMLTHARIHQNGMATFLAVIFILITFVLPLLELLLLAVHGVAVLFPRVFHICGDHCQLAASWLNSFATVDIYLLVCIGVLLKIKHFADSNLVPQCAPFVGLMNNEAVLKIVGLSFAASDSCFDVRTSLRNGWWLLLASVLLRIAAWCGVAMVARTHSVHQA